MALSLAEARAEAGDEVVLAAPSGSLDGTALPRGVARAVVAAGGRGPVGAAVGAAALARAARRARPDLIHAHNPRATASAWIGAVAAGRPRAPVVSTYHGVRQEDRRGATRVLARASGVVCVSEDLRAELERHGFPPGTARVVPNGVPVAPPLTEEHAHALREELGLAGHVVTLVGRLVEQKRPERFADAAAAVLATRSDVTFLVVGEGPLRDTLERQVAALDVERGVRFAGLREDARELIALSDLIVFTSAWEGLSMVALEGLAAGVPVVASDVSGMRELLGSGAGRVVAEPSAGCFARAITELLDDADARRAMGARGRELVEERYSLAAMAAGYAEAYDAALAARS